MKLTHLIHKQIFDLQLPSTDGAHRMQQEIRAVYDEDLLPLIDQLFSEISGPGELLRINRLELNLGVISPLQLRTQLIAQLKTVLTEKLAEARAKAQIRIGTVASTTQQDVIIKGGELEMEAVLQTANTSIPSLLEAFFVTGNLPWWLPEQASPPDFDALTERLLEEQPEQFIQLMMHLLKQPTVAIRMVHQLSPKLLKRIETALWPSRLQASSIPSSILTALKWMTQVAGSSSELITTNGSTPAPLTLMAAATAARVVSLPATQFSVNTTQTELLAWHIIALATSYSMPSDALLKLAESTLVQSTSAKRASKQIPEEFVSLLLPRIQQQQHSLPKSPLSRLLEVVVLPENNILSPTEAEQLLAQLPALTADAENEVAIIRQLIETSAPLKTKQAQAILAAADPEIALLLITREEEIAVYNSTSVQEETQTQKRSQARKQAVESKKKQTKQIQAVEEQSSTGRQQTKQEEQASLNLNDKFRALQEAELYPLPVKSETEELIEIFSDEFDEDDIDEELAGNKRHRISRWGGLVLLGPYLPALFAEAGYLNEENTFKTKEDAYRAVFLLHYICTGKTKAPEYALPLHKLLCGLAFNKSIPKSIRLTKKEKQEADDLLDAMAEQWSSLRSPFGDAIRQNFMQRTALIERKDNAVLIRIQRVSIDILLDSLPWSISIIRLPWTQHLIQTEW